MTRTNPPTQLMERTPRLHLAFELASRSWKLAFTVGGRKIRIRVITAGDIDALRAEIPVALRAFKLPADTPVVSCYEAGRDGFWLHRLLLTLGIHNYVIDPASMLVNRRARRKKTDRIDARRMVQSLVQFLEGNDEVWSVVRVPSVADEDARRRHRELAVLKGECTAHSNRIGSLLILVGIAPVSMAKLPRVIETLRQPNGEPIPPHLREEIDREWQRWSLVNRQRLDTERARDREIEERPADDTALQKVAVLAKVRGIGNASATVLVRELFGWRTFHNRREVGGAVGLCGTPYDSGESRHEQGISKQGSAQVRAVLVQLAWGWLRHQRDSKLSRWFVERYGSGTSRHRRVGIVAVARKLAIDLWRLVERGVIADGMVLAPT